MESEEATEVPHARSGVSPEEQLLDELFNLARRGRCADLSLHDIGKMVSRITQLTLDADQFSKVLRAFAEILESCSRPPIQSAALHLAKAATARIDDVSRLRGDQLERWLRFFKAAGFPLGAKLEQPFVLRIRSVVPHLTARQLSYMLQYVGVLDAWTEDFVVDVHSRIIDLGACFENRDRARAKRGLRCVTAPVTQRDSWRSLISLLKSSADEHQSRFAVAN